MAYIDDVLALNPDIHYPCSDADGIVRDLSGNGHDATLISQSGTQYVRQVEALVRNSPSEPNGQATLLNSALNATTGLSVINVGGGPGFSVPGVGINGFYTFVAWFRWKANNASLMVLRGDAAGQGGFIEVLFLGSTVLRVTHSNAASLGGTQNIDFNITGLRPDSRHMIAVRHNLDGTISLFLDGVKIGADMSIIPMHATYQLTGIRFGDTILIPTRPLRHYIQHISYWWNTPLSDSQITGLWNSGKTRPGRVDTFVQFDEPAYADGVSALTTGLWEKTFNTGFVSSAIVRNSVDSDFGGRVLDFRSGANQAAVKWNEIFREPQQRFLTRVRVNTGFNLEFGIILLGTWDYVSNQSFVGSGSTITGIEIGVSGNNLRIRQKVADTVTILATSPFVRAAGDWFWMRGEVDTTTREIRAKIWADADPEPSAWNIDINTMDAAFQDGEGFLALYCSLANTNTDIDVINVSYNSGPPIPEKPNISVDNIDNDSARLIGSAFVGTVHEASQWQVQDFGGDFSSPFIDTGFDTINLLEFIIPNVLTPGATYQARVRYQDNNGLLSPYSDPVTFTTLLPAEITPCVVIDPPVSNIPNLPDEFPVFVGGKCEPGEIVSFDSDEENTGAVPSFDPCS